MGDNPSGEERRARPLEKVRAQRFILLSAVSKHLTSLDYKAFLPAVANLLVHGTLNDGAYLADWCAIDVSDEDQLRTVAVACTQSLKKRWGDDVPCALVRAAVDRVLSTGKSSEITLIAIAIQSRRT